MFEKIAVKIKKIMNKYVEVNSELWNELEDIVKSLENVGVYDLNNHILDLELEVLLLKEKLARRGLNV